jgi:hypothetical protein
VRRVLSHAIRGQEIALITVVEQSSSTTSSAGALTRRGSPVRFPFSVPSPLSLPLQQRSLTSLHSQLQTPHPTFMPRRSARFNRTEFVPFSSVFLPPFSTFERPGSSRSSEDEPLTSILLRFPPSSPSPSFSFSLFTPRPLISPCQTWLRDQNTFNRKATFGGGRD